jgi:hypothetical protein
VSDAFAEYPAKATAAAAAKAINFVFMSYDF